MKVAKLMIREPVVVSPDETLQKAAARMDEKNVRHLPVIEHGKVMGVISDRDLLEATGWQADRFFESSENRLKLVRDYMRVPVETAQASEDIGAAAARMLRWGIGCLPVVDDGAAIGMLTETDLLTAFADTCTGPQRDGVFDPVVSERMARKMIEADSKQTVGEGIALCREHRIRHLPVIFDGWFVGLVSDRDLRMRVGRLEVDSLLEKVMSTDIISVPKSARLSEATKAMLRHKIGAVAVTEERKLLGLMTSANVLEHCSQVDWKGV